MTATRTAGRPLGHSLRSTDGDPRLELTLAILRGIPPVLRAAWMKRYLPKTYAMLCMNGKLFDNHDISTNSSVHLFAHTPADFYRPNSLI